MVFLLLVRQGEVGEDEDNVEIETARDSNDENDTTPLPATGPEVPAAEEGEMEKFVRVPLFEDNEDDEDEEGKGDEQTEAAETSSIDTPHPAPQQHQEEEPVADVEGEEEEVGGSGGSLNLVPSPVGGHALSLMYWVSLC
jgi:hypothetical protein